MIPNKLRGLSAPHEEWENLLALENNSSFHSATGAAGLTPPPKGMISPGEKNRVGFDPQEVFQKSLSCSGTSGAKHIMIGLNIHRK